MNSVLNKRNIFWQCNMGSSSVCFSYLPFPLCISLPSWQINLPVVVRESVEISVWQGDYDRGYLYECEFLEEDEKAKLPPDQLYQPTRVIPIHNTNDRPVNCIHFRLVRNFVCLNFQNVRVIPSFYAVQLTEPCIIWNMQHLRCVHTSACCAT